MRAQKADMRGSFAAIQSSAVARMLSLSAMSGAPHIPEGGKTVVHAGVVAPGRRLQVLTERVVGRLVEGQLLHLPADRLLRRQVGGAEPGLAQRLHPRHAGPAGIAGLAAATQRDMAGRS